MKGNPDVSAFVEPRPCTAEHRHRSTTADCNCDRCTVKYKMHFPTYLMLSRKLRELGRTTEQSANLAIFFEHRAL